MAGAGGTSEAVFSAGEELAAAVNGGGAHGGSMVLEALLVACCNDRVFGVGYYLGFC